MIEKIKCTPQEAGKIKVMIGNLLDCFPTGRIRKKDMERYNKHLNFVMTYIVSSDSCTFDLGNEPMCDNAKITSEKCQSCEHKSLCFKLQSKEKKE